MEEIMIIMIWKAKPKAEKRDINFKERKNNGP